jgi:hypothetical protein
LHAALGDKAQAIAALEKAFETRSKLLLWTGRDPIYQTLHNEPGFREVLRKMNLQVVV